MAIIVSARCLLLLLVNMQLGFAKPMANVCCRATIDG
jgi:hypothetical protein